MDTKIIFPFFFLSVSLDSKDLKKEGIQKKKKSVLGYLKKKGGYVLCTLTSNTKKREENKKQM